LNRRIRQEDGGIMRVVQMHAQKKIALVAHDNMKKALMEWALYNRDLLARHELYATGSTGALLADALSVPVNCFKSGPLGGDQQIGAKVAEGGIDMVIFFWDPLEPHPHDVDVKALLRIAVVYNIPIACNRASADFVISSHLMRDPYERLLEDYEDMQRQRIAGLQGRAP
jgi:methylglyoxal synthase